MYDVSGLLLNINVIKVNNSFCTKADVHGSSSSPMTNHNTTSSPYEQLDIESQSQHAQYQALGKSVSCTSYA